MPEDDDPKVRKYRALLAPGTPLRDGLERILRGRTGALIVLGNNRSVQQISTGGFHIECPFTPTALRELAKMDGAIIVDADCETIAGAGVHLVPNPDLPTLETGTRHRTADRVAQQTDCPVITVSASMSTIALFLGGDRFPIEHSSAILGQANLALQTLERYKVRLLEVLSRLSALEVHDQVTIRDLALVAQRLERVRRLERTTIGYVTELGTDGHLLQLQLLEVQVGLDEIPALLERDYRPEGADGFSLARLDSLSDAELVDPNAVAKVIGFSDQIDAKISPRGYRQLAHLTRLPQTVAVRLVEHFGTLQALFGASTGDLLEVDGIGEGRARMIRDGLVRLAESVYEERLD